MRNRLTGLTAPGLTASFAYDPLGRRIERTVNGETTAYLYDGIQAMGEVRGGQATALLTGLAVDEAIARYASSGRLTQLTDQLGSVIRQINEAGATQNATAYSPYGEAATTGDDQGNSTEYTARENDGTGLYFYRARYFDPILKRFISEDPIGTAGGVNLAGYVEGDPIYFRDPEGHFGLPGLVVGAGIGAISGAVGALIQGGCFDDVINGALAGGLVGGAAGLLGPAAFAAGGAGLQTLLNGAIGAVGNFAGQVSTAPIGNLNAGSVAGAAVGGALGGLPSIAAAGAGVGAEISAGLLGAQLDLASGSVGNALGKTLDESLGRGKPKKKCGCNK